MLKIGIQIIAIIIMIIVYGRMIEIYLSVSLAPIPFSTFANREWGQIGQNYLKLLFALSFQGFFIIVCVAIYSVLTKEIVFNAVNDIDSLEHGLWTYVGLSLVLIKSLFSTGTLAKSILAAH